MSQISGGQLMASVAAPGEAKPRQEKQRGRATQTLDNKNELVWPQPLCPWLAVAATLGRERHQPGARGMSRSRGGGEAICSWPLRCRRGRRAVGLETASWRVRGSTFP